LGFGLLYKLIDASYNLFIAMLWFWIKILKWLRWPWSQQCRHDNGQYISYYMV
jgi:hypothetical protein